MLGWLELKSPTCHAPKAMVFDVPPGTLWTPIADPANWSRSSANKNVNRYYNIYD
jgi:hypothetical protein